jgi:hypothetical protein
VTVVELGALAAQGSAPEIAEARTVDDARCDALFVSGLQRSDAPDADRVAEAIRATVRRFGIGGCASRMAQEFGDHPEAAAERMRWVRSLLGLANRRSSQTLT